MNEKEDADSGPPQASDLRREAERRLRNKKATPVEDMAEVNVRALLHELQVHQIELEMQNEELLRAQTTVQEVSDKYHDLFDFAPVSYFRLDEQGRILEVNLAGAALLGLDRSTAVRQRFAQYVAPQSRARFAEFCGNVLGADSKQTREIELQRGEHRVYALLEGISARGGEGIRSFRVTATDVTHRKRIEDAQTFLLQCGYAGSGEGFFQTLARYLAQSLGMDYVCIDRLVGDGLAAQTVAVYNDGKFDDNVAYTLKDTPCGDVVGKTICCFPKDVCQLFPKDVVLQKLKAESYVGTTLWSFDGKPIGLIAVIGRKPLANPFLAESILKLVAVRAAGELERKQAEEAVQKAHDRLFTVLESITDAFFSLDRDFRLTYVNREAERIFRKTRQEVLGRNLWELFPEAVGSLFQREYERAMAENTTAHFEEFYPPFNQWFSVHAYPSPAGLSVYFEDITERKRAEEALRLAHDHLELRVQERTAELAERAEQLRALAVELTQAEQRERRRLAQVLHDHLQQLLVAARMKVGLLRRRVQDEQLGTTIGQLDDLLNETINESRSLAVQLCPPVLYNRGLAAGLEWLARQTHEKFDLAVEVEADPAAEPPEETTRAFLFQAAGELLLNAAKHAQARRVQVRMSRVAVQPSRLPPGAGGRPAPQGPEQVCIEVCDDGVGFDPAQGGGKTGRGGFGMFSIRQRLEVLDGQMEVVSNPGQGTQVTIRAPLGKVAE